jgi:hypothetical protein
MRSECAHVLPGIPRSLLVTNNPARLRRRDSSAASLGRGQKACLPPIDRPSVEPNSIGPALSWSYDVLSRADWESRGPLCQMMAGISAPSKPIELWQAKVTGAVVQLLSGPEAAAWLRRSPVGGRYAFLL